MKCLVITISSICIVSMPLLFAADAPTPAPQVPPPAGGAPGSPGAAPAPAPEPAPVPAPVPPAAPEPMPSVPSRPASQVPTIEEILAALRPELAQQYGPARADAERDGGVALRAWLARTPRMSPIWRGVLEIDLADAVLSEVEAACQQRGDSFARKLGPVNQTNAMRAKRLSILADMEGFLVGVRTRTSMCRELQEIITTRLNLISSMRGLVSNAQIAPVGRRGF